jgi:hypothetical protein
MRRDGEALLLLAPGASCSNAQPAPENLVLDLQVLHLPGEFIVGGEGDQVEDRVTEAGHGRRIAKPRRLSDWTTFLHTAPRGRTTLDLVTRKALSFSQRTKASGYSVETFWMTRPDSSP